MHAQSFNHMFSSDFKQNFLQNSLRSSDNLAAKNREDLKDEPIPEDVRIPTGEEIREFKNWEMVYRTKNPKASEREVRRAVQKQFNIVVIQGQNMVK